MTREPVIAVGLVENAGAVKLHLLGEYTDGGGRAFSPGSYHCSCVNGTVECGDMRGPASAPLKLAPAGDASRFRLEITIGIDFHWEQKQEHTFSGGLRLLPKPGGRLSVINEVPLETYILSVSCSEMNASSPEEFLKAHSIISRSWLLAQLESKQSPAAPPPPSPAGTEIIRWYDRQSHHDFDVCADDHCQRYQGVDLIAGSEVSRAVKATRGMVLMHGGTPCDARFSKCCGGITEDFRLAWGETFYPYLVPVADAAHGQLPAPPLTDEAAARAFIMTAPDAWCNCGDASILRRVLNNYDQTTGDFYRWTVRLTAGEIAGLLQKKLQLDIGRPLALEPVERGMSGRIKRLRLCGEISTVVIGKELEIRRALSPSHLYSSAFMVDTEGPVDRPESFVLRGAGWGHGVGLCQIGAAVMACRGIGHREILGHYYPGSGLERLYG